MKIFYFTGVIIITLFMISYFVYQERLHSIEIEKIKRLEKKCIEEEEKLEEIRSKSTPCPIKNLKNPRKCYFDSNYKCSWNESAKRCDLK